VRHRCRHDFCPGCAGAAKKLKVPDGVTHTYLLINT
jgi:hypothetical protein